MAENMMQTLTGKFSKQWPEPQLFPQFLDKMGNMMSEDYDCPPASRSCPCRCFRCSRTTTLSRRSTLRSSSRSWGRREGAGLPEHAAVEVAVGGRAWLQSLQFHNLGGGAADYWAVLGRSANECAGRRSSRLAGSDRASFIWDGRATLPESLFLMIRPGAVDISRPMMFRYSVIYGVTR
jgi:hypothetical protein